MKNAARLTLVLAALVLATVPLALAADAVKAVGTWDTVATTPNGDMPSVLVIKQVDGGLKAEMELDGAPRRAHEPGTRRRGGAGVLAVNLIDVHAHRIAFGPW